MGTAIPLKIGANTLKQVDFQALCNEAQQNGELIEQRVGCEIRFNLPQQLGRGGESEIHLRSGMILIVRDGELWQSIKLENHYCQFPPLISKFHLSGNSRVLTPNTPEIKDDYMEVAGYNYLYHLPGVTEFEEWYAKESVQLVMILIQPERWQEFDQSCEDLPSPLRRLIEGDLTTRFHQPLGKTTPAMQQALHQVLHCPYQGIMKQLYLESKALELITLQFKHWSDAIQELERFSQGKATLIPRLRSDDVERLHRAKEILLQRIDNPPSLLALAQQVGLDDYKLKWGFRRLFGTTVFGCLHEYRMERSRQLLVAGQTSVTEVAYMVGYNSLPSFSKAFRKKFGSSPLAYTSTLRQG